MLPVLNRYQCVDPIRRKGTAIKKYLTPAKLWNVGYARKERVIFASLVLLALVRLVLYLSVVHKFHFILLELAVAASVVIMTHQTVPHYEVLAGLRVIMDGQHKGSR